MFKNKKSLILLIVLLIAIAIGLGLFFTNNDNNVPEHCYNQNLDTEEEGIDCGPVCKKKCQEFSSLETEWVKTTNISGGKRYFIALVKNPNPLYGVSNFNYKFEGKVADEKVTTAGKDFILPQEEKYLFQEVPTGQGNIQDMELIVTDSSWKRFASYKEPSLFIIHQKVEEIDEGGFNLRASGRLINDSVYNLRKVAVKVVVFDTNNQPLTVNKTYLSNIKAKERRDFKVFWQEDISQDQISRTEMMPETNIFEESNFVKDYNYENVDVRYE